VPSPALRRARGAARRGAWWGWPDRLREAPTSLRWALAGQLAVIAALLGVLLRPAADATPDAYRTLTSPATASASTGSSAEIRVVFAPEITEGEIRELLRAERATIGDGPSSMGAYTLRVRGAAERDRLLARLREHPRVQLAEPRAGSDAR
jgi:hypothetical protein